MKKIYYWVGLLALLFLTNTNSFGQVSYGRKYRVIAYKNGNPNIFSVSNEVTVVPSMSLYIPNTFTPNGDGLNDTFGISGEAIKSFEIKIFNRWGQIVFETNDATSRWDGTFKGEKLQAGAYIYKVAATGPTGQRQMKEGNVNLIL